MIYAPDEHVDLTACDDPDRDEFVRINVPAVDVDDPSVSRSGLELFFNRDGGIWTARRDRVCGIWQEPEPLVFDDDAGSVSNPSLGPDDTSIHFIRGDEPRVVSRSSVGKPWGPESVASDGLRARIDEHYAEQGEDGVTILDVFRPSSDVSLVSLTLAGSGRVIHRDDGVVGMKVDIAEGSPKEVWSTADEASLYYERSGRILSRAGSPGEPYDEMLGPDVPGYDPWLLTIGERAFLYMSIKISDDPLVRQLGVVELP